MASPHWHPAAKSVEVSPGVTYAYVHMAPRAGKPYVLLLHGFPESSWDWHAQIAALGARGYGLVVPDLLGSGWSSKPGDAAAYRMKKMAGEVLAVLDAAGVAATAPVVGVGHDFGSALLSALHVYHPGRFAAYAFLAVMYAPPLRLDVDAVNAMTEASFGYPALGYFKFLGEDPEAPALLERDLMATSSLFYSQDEGHWPKNVCPVGAAKAWLEQGRTVALPDWLQGEALEMRHRILRQGGFTGPVNWYRQAVSDVNLKDLDYPLENLHLSKPYLFVEGTGGDGAWPTGAQIRKKQWVDQWKVEHIDAGHWQMLQNPEAVNQKLVKFLEGLNL